MKSKYSVIKSICSEYSKISAEVIDNELIYYAAAKENLHNEFTRSLKKYAHITEDWPESHLNIMMSELIAQRIFKKQGLIHKFLNHSYIKSLPSDQYDFLRKISKHPWRFTFSTIVGRPADEFFSMEDVFTEENYLLYSPGMEKSLLESPCQMWLLLIGFNGVCWQSFGLNIPLPSIHVDDIYFFATELDKKIEFEEEIAESINKNPIPFLMLLTTSSVPKLTHKNKEMGYWISESDTENVSFETEKIKKVLTVEWNKGIYKLSTRDGTSMEHQAHAYFDEEKQTISRYAYTETGFKRLTKILNSLGFNLSDEAQVYLSFNMKHFMELFFQAEMILDPHLELFETKSDKDAEAMRPMNDFMAAAIDAHNRNEPVDVEKIARQVGLDVQTATDIWKSVGDTIKNMKKGLK